MRLISNFSFYLSRSPSAVAASAVALLAACSPSDALSWSNFVGAWTVTIAAVLVSRAGSARFRMPRPFVENVLVLGKTEMARAVITELKKRPRYRVLDAAEPGKPNRVLKNGVSLVPVDAQQGSVQPHRIVVALLERRSRVPIEVLLDAKRKGIVIEEALYVYERLTGKLALDRVYPSYLIYSNELRRHPIHCALQRVMGVVLSSAGLVLCAPLLAAIALLVKLDSPGPALFVQERMGKNGRRFPLVKFRTMHSDAEPASEWVKDNGARITRVGRWLRKFRLDEAPQLFNVLLGHMSLVGPRPHPASNYTLFMDRIPFYAFRSMMLPGITGWAQVHYGYANNLEEEREKMCYDLYYIKYFSVWLDIRILLKTIKVVILGQESRQRGPEQPQAPQSDVGADNRLDAA